MSAKITGEGSVGEGINLFIARLSAAVENACHRTAEDTRTKVVRDINTQKPNPKFAKPKARKGKKLTARQKHIPSPAGGPPNADTGSLSSRYTTTLRQYSRLHVAGVIVAGVNYAALLEFGTSRMKPRPHLLPRFYGERAAFIARVKATGAVVIKETKGAKK